MVGKPQRTIRVKWVRSGIGFSHRQKVMVRSLGLLRLNQVVERPDTPQIRGLVANIPHLVQIVSEMASSAFSSVPEYTIRPREAMPVQPADAQAVETAKKKIEAPRRGSEESVAEPVPQGKSERHAKATSQALEEVKAEKPAKRVATEKAKASKPVAAKKKTQEKAATAKGAKPSRKGKK